MKRIHRYLILAGLLFTAEQVRAWGRKETVKVVNRVRTAEGRNTYDGSAFIGVLPSPTLPTRSSPKTRNGRTQVTAVVRSFEKVISSCGQHVDVAQLLQACRNFASVLRDIGLTAAARDMENNVRKAEAIYHAAPPDRRRSLALLLEMERESGVHGAGGELRDPSAAMGLLWLRRALAFQSEMYDAIVASMDPMDAAQEAYRLHLQPYHGWALRKLFKMSFSSMALPRKAMLAKLGGFRPHAFEDEEEQATLEDLKDLVKVWRPILHKWRQTYEELDLEDDRRA